MSSTEDEIIINARPSTSKYTLKHLEALEQHGHVGDGVEDTQDGSETSREHLASMQLMDRAEPVEVLEMVLILLDFKTLLIAAQRVSQTWNTIISNSMRLQKKLFKVACRSINEVVGLNMIEDNSYMLYDSENVGSEEYESLWAVVNTLVLRVADPRADYRGEHFHSHLREGILPYTISSKRGIGSWEKMYFLQPSWIDRTFKICTGDKLCKASRPGDNLREITPGMNQDWSFFGNELELDWTNVNWAMREIMDYDEGETLERYGFTVNWRKSELPFPASAIQYDAFILLEREAFAKQAEESSTGSDHEEDEEGADNGED